MLTLTLIPLALLPTGLFVLSWRSTDPSTRADGNILFYIYALMATVGFSALSVGRTIFSILIDLVLFGINEQGQPMKLDTLEPNDPKIWISVLLTAFVKSGLSTEVFKYLAVSYARRKFPGQRQGYTHTYIDCAIAGALALINNANVALILSEVANGRGSKDLTFLMLERIVLAVPFHALTASLMGRRAQIRDLEPTSNYWSLWEVIGPSILWHGCSEVVTKVFIENDILLQSITGDRRWVLLLVLHGCLLAGLLRQNMQEARIFLDLRHKSS